MEKQTIKQQLIDTTGDVLIEAVKFGLEEAGVRILGPTAWNGFKRIMSPIVKKLQQRFPALSFSMLDNKDSIEAAEEAVKYLQSSAELQNLLLTNFFHLEKGQEEILSSMKRLERVAKKTSQDVGYILEISQEILAEIKKEDSEVQTYELSTWVDVSDIVEQQLIIARTQARRRGEELHMPVVGFVFYTMGIEMFRRRVLEDGIANKLYKSKIMGAIITSRVSGTYTNDQGMLHRKITTDVPQWGLSEKHTVTYSIYRRKEGAWEPVKTLEQNEY